jgi:hypothetical protein
MAKIRVIKTITFDGKKQQTGTEITLTSQRLETMLINFKNQKIDSKLYIDILEVEVQEKPKTKRRTKKA